MKHHAFAGIRWGLCCAFAQAPIKFRTTTATSLAKLDPRDAREKLSRLCLENADALHLALQACVRMGIGSFRVNSQILPLKTHPLVGYDVGHLPRGAEIERRFRNCGGFAATNGIRTGFHPDQYVVLNSPREEVVRASVNELEYQCEVAEWIGADVVNIHAGGAYGDKAAALDRFQRSLDLLSERARSRLTIENDDRVFTPSDLLPVCFATGVPLVYDVHHHRCLPDGRSIEDITTAALTTWNREPLFHLSSPKQGWSGPRPHEHHDYIDSTDFPPAWRRLTLTVEVEAKAKELAVLQLREQLAATGTDASRKHREVGSTI